MSDYISFKKGIVAMRLQGNRVRHTTLWNGSNFADVEFNYYNFLDETNYIINELYFWELL